MNRQPEITAATRQNLAEAFWQLYGQKSIKQIRIKEITDLAGYHRATFYEYFTDIYDVLRQEEADLIEQIEEMVALKLHAGGIDEILEQIANFYMQNGRRLSLLIGAGGDPEFMNRFKRVLYPTFQFSMQLTDTVTSSIIFEFGISGLLMAVHCWYENRSQLPVEAFIRILRSLVEKGIPQTIEACHWAPKVT